MISVKLNEAYDNGVEILVYRCDNQLDGITLIPEPINFDLKKEDNDS